MHVSFPEKRVLKEVGKSFKTGKLRIKSTLKYTEIYHLKGPTRQRIAPRNITLMNYMKYYIALIINYNPDFQTIALYVIATMTI